MTKCSAQELTKSLKRWDFYKVQEQRKYENWKSPRRGNVPYLYLFADHGWWRPGRMHEV
jgi:hypothetical protein